MDDLKQFWSQYKGAVIGAIIAILILCTRLFEVIIGIILIVMCIYIGNYVQYNKHTVKEKLKRLIDKM